MQRDDDLMEELQANKALFDSTFTADEKIDAFRKQSIILDEIAKPSSEANMMASFEEHFNIYNFSMPYKEYTEERKKNMDKLLHGVPRRYSAMSLSVDEYLKEHKSQLEPECSGKHRSCLKDEVHAEDLKIFQDILGKIPSAGIIDTSPKEIAWSTDLRPENGSGTSTLRQSTLNPYLFKGAGAQNQSKASSFRTAREEMIIQNMKKNNEPSTSNSRTLFNYGASKKSLGARRNVRSGFVPPIRQENNASPSGTPPDSIDSSPTEPTDERLRGIDPKMIELITNEIMHKYQPIGWSDIAGLDYAKATIKEAVVWPLLRPDIFTGLRRPPRGILLFGPPGTGKTLIGKCIACQSKATFFSISASSLTSKWVGDGEKMVRALFAVAAVHQPSVVFIDEIDSLLSQRSNTEHESSRRLKTEFLVQLDGANTTGDERILIVGATNRPQELDEAARRRLVRRLYIPLPELSARIQILKNLLQTVRNNIAEEEIVDIGNLTNGYSGADMEALCREASMEPIRSIPPEDIPYFSEENLRPVSLEDFTSAVTRVRASVSQTDLQQYADWDRMYGAGQ